MIINNPKSIVPNQSDLRHFSEQALPDLGASHGNHHRAVSIDVHQGRFGPNADLKWNSVDNISESSTVIYSECKTDLVSDRSHCNAPLSPAVGPVECFHLL